MSTILEDRWLTAGQAQRLLGCSRERLYALADCGHVVRRHLPGAWPRFLESSVLALAERSTTGTKEEVAV